MKIIFRLFNALKNYFIGLKLKNNYNFKCFCPGRLKAAAAAAAAGKRALKIFFLNYFFIFIFKNNISFNYYNFPVLVL